MFDASLVNLSKRAKIDIYIYRNKRYTIKLSSYIAPLPATILETFKELVSLLSH